MNIHDATMPLNTPIHPVSVTSISLCAVFTGLSSFWLVPMSTVPNIKGLHHQKCIAARATPCCSCVAYITFLASLGGPNWLRMTQTMDSIPKSASVLLDSRKWVTCFRIRRVGLGGYAYLAGHGHHAHLAALGYLECYTLLSLCALPPWKL